MTQGEDAVSKSIRKQIANAQKELQELSADKELTMEEKMEEFMFLGLRMLEGVTDMAFTREFGIHMESIYGKVMEDLTKKGLLKQKGTRIALTGLGIDVSNYVLSRFLLDGEG